MTTPALNVPNILKIRNAILANPQAFDMTDFIDSSDVEEDADDHGEVLTGHDVIVMMVEQPHCGTTACIAGWATALAHCESPEIYPVSMGMLAVQFIKTGATYMGLDPWSALELFFACKLNEDGVTVTQWAMGDVTPEDAAETLRKLTETGEVDWSHLTCPPICQYQGYRLVFGTSTLKGLGLVTVDEAKI